MGCIQSVSATEELIATIKALDTAQTAKLLQTVDGDELSLQNSNFDASHFKVLSDALSARPTSIRALKLGRNAGMGAGGVEHLASLLALRPNVAITELWLDHCALDGAALSLLANALESQHTLTSLYLDHNALGDEGAQQLANALARNQHPTLTELDVGNNVIGDAGAAALAAATGSPICKLKTLFLSANRIGEAGALAFVSVAQRGLCCLEHLDLQKNAIGAAAQARLATIEGLSVSVSDQGGGAPPARV